MNCELTKEEIISPNLLEIKANRLDSFLKIIRKLDQALDIIGCDFEDIDNELESHWKCNAYSLLSTKVIQDSHTLMVAINELENSMRHTRNFLIESANTYRQIIKEEK